MKTDELAFFNQQLALMLRDGIPLEGALKQLAHGMRRGALRSELQGLEADLARGIPLAEALSHRQLPEFYSRMLAAGAAANDLPGMLTLLADHYHRTHALWIRLKGLMTYPLIVLVVSLALTVLLSLLFRKFVIDSLPLMPHGPNFVLAGMWLSPVLLALATALITAALLVPGLRSTLRWRLPAFREASLAQLASALALMLRQGCPLPDALALAESIESRSPAAKALRRWRTLLVSGQGKLADWQDPVGTLPPLFTWLVKSSFEDPAAGFQKAAHLYQGRALYRTELLLYGALPVSVLLLGQVVFWQIAPVLQVMVRHMQMLGDMGM
ncbi:MAG TPA: type II secretion system F family protein [Clostridia bacterium]|nr:type II secretion system F family protein [Clostridia bacterium]